jgi:hypothetical protein
MRTKVYVADELRTGYHNAYASGSDWSRAALSMLSHTAPLPPGRALAFNVGPGRLSAPAAECHITIMMCLHCLLGADDAHRAHNDMRWHIARFAHGFRLSLELSRCRRGSVVQCMALHARLSLSSASARLVALSLSIAITLRART